MSSGNHARARERRKDRRDLLAVGTSVVCTVLWCAGLIVIWILSDHDLAVTGVALLCGIMAALAMAALLANDPNERMFDDDEE